MQKINVETEWADCTNEEKFFILTCVDGCGSIEWCGNSENDGTNGQNVDVVNKQGFCEEIKMGDSYLIPATLGKYILKGNLSVIKSYPM